jgi:hypothetical protein
MREVIGNRCDDGDRHEAADSALHLRWTIPGRLLQGERHGSSIILWRCDLEMIASQGIVQLPSPLLEPALNKEFSGTFLITTDELLHHLCRHRIVDEGRRQVGDWNTGTLFSSHSRSWYGNGRRVSDRVITTGT